MNRVGPTLFAIFIQKYFTLFGTQLHSKLHVTKLPTLEEKKYMKTIIFGHWILEDHKLILKRIIVHTGAVLWFLKGGGGYTWLKCNCVDVNKCYSNYNYKLLFFFRIFFFVALLKSLSDVLMEATPTKLIIKQSFHKNKWRVRTLWSPPPPPYGSAPTIILYAAVTLWLYFSLL